MTDLLDRLVARVRGSEESVQPRIASLYESVNRPDLEEIWVEEVAGPRPPASLRSARPGAPVTERSIDPRDRGTEETATSVTPGVANRDGPLQPDVPDWREALAPTAMSPSLESSPHTGSRVDESDATATAWQPPPIRDPQGIPAAPSEPPSPLAVVVAIAPPEPGETPDDDRSPDAPRRTSVSPNRVVTQPAVSTPSILARRRIAHEPPPSIGETRPTPSRQPAVASDLEQLRPEARPAASPTAGVAAPSHDASPQASAPAVPEAPSRPVRITIGRIEVRANPPKPPEPHGDRHAGSSSLDGYLDRWSRGA
jgi:hypothetical protein